MVLAHGSESRPLPVAANLTPVVSADQDVTIHVLPTYSETPFLFEPGPPTQTTACRTVASPFGGGGVTEKIITDAFTSLSLKKVKELRLQSVNQPGQVTLSGSSAVLANPGSPEEWLTPYLFADAKGNLHLIVIAQIGRL